MRNHILVIAVIAALPLGARTASGQGTAAPVIEVTGVGEARVTPDRATISLGVQIRAATAAAAAAENARVQRAVLDTIRALGIGSDRISTTGYTAWPETRTDGSGQSPKVVAYVITNTVRVEVRRLEQVAQIIDAGLAKGANEVSNLQFYSSRADSVRRVALAKAVAEARADAEALARAAGGSLGGLMGMSTSESPVRPMPELGMRAFAAAQKTPIEPGEQTIRATVLVRWSFAPGR